MLYFCSVFNMITVEFSTVPEICDWTIDDRIVFRRSFSTSRNAPPDIVFPCHFYTAYSWDSPFCNRVDTKLNRNHISVQSINWNGILLKSKKLSLHAASYRGNRVPHYICPFFCDLSSLCVCVCLFLWPQNDTFIRNSYGARGCSPEAHILNVIHYSLHKTCI